MSDNARLCSRCRRELTALSPDGLCPRCLLERAFMSDVEEDIAFSDVRSIGDYELLDQIARGGMGVVYRARQRRLNRIVALKLISAGELTTAEFLKRFRIEAESAASLDHPNIIPIYEIGEDNGHHYFSMRLAEGGSLADRLASGQRLTSRDSVRLLVKVARAVHYAHQRGILHRDIKPSNVLLDAQGEPFLADFGLAKLIEQGTRITHTLALLGTPSYISPEQAAGASEITTAVDVYGLGAVLYELLTGAPPFAGGSTMVTIRQVLEKEPEPPAQRNSEVDRDLETICLKCLEKSPNRRYASCEGLAEDLERWEKGEPIIARPSTKLSRVTKWVRRHPGWATAIITIAVTVVGAAVLSDMMRGRAEEALRVSHEQTSKIIAQQKELAARQTATERQLSRSLFLQGVRFAEEGRTGPALAYWGQSLRLAPDNAASASRIFHTLTRNRFLQLAFPPIEDHGRIMGLSFSPDGSRLAVASAGRDKQIWVRDAATGRLLYSVGGQRLAYQVEFSPDGRHVAWVEGGLGWGRGYVRIADAGTGDPVGPDLVIPEGVLDLKFSPDGSKLAFAVNQDCLYVADAATSRLCFKRPEVKPRIYCQANVAWAPDSRSVFSSAVSSIIQHYDAETGREIGSWSQDVGLVGSPLAISPAGDMVANPSDRSTRVFSSADGRLLWSLAQESYVHYAAFSPDKERLLTTGNDGSICAWSLKTGTLMNRIEVGTPQLKLIFSKDGRRFLTFGFDEAARIWDTATLTPLCEPVRHHSRVRDAAFSPTGERLATGTEEGSVAIWNLETAQASEIILSQSNAVLSACFSPDGQTIATGGDDGCGHVWSRDGRALLSTSESMSAHVDKVQFSVDGRVFMTTAGEISRVWDTRQGQPVGPLIAHSGMGKSLLSPDGAVVVAWGRDRWRLWDVGSGQPKFPEIRDAYVMAKMVFSPDGSLLLSSNYRLDETLWDAATGKKIRIASSGNDPSEINFLDGGKRLLLFNGFNLHVADTQTGQQIGPEIRGDQDMRIVRVSEDGKRLVIATEDNIVRVYDRTTGTPLIEPLGRGVPVTAAAIDCRAARFALGGSDGRIEVFDLESGQSLTGTLRIEPKKDEISRSPISVLEFSRDGRQLLVVDLAGAARLWDLGPALAEKIPAWLPDLAELVGGLRLSANPVSQQTMQLTPVPYSERAAARSRFASLSETNAWWQLARWFYADPEHRAASPIVQTK